MTLFLVLLALLVLAFRPAYMASNSVSSMPRAAVLENGDLVLDLIAEHVPVWEKSDRQFTRLLATVLCEEDSNGNLSFKFLKSLRKNIRLVVEAMQADYHAIEGHCGLWVAVSGCIAEALTKISESCLCTVSPEEALDHAIVMMAFSFSKHDAPKYWAGMDRLKDRFTDMQWARLPDWAVYVARPCTFMLAPQLLKRKFYSMEQIASLIRDIEDVVIRGLPFRRSGLFRPERIASSPANFSTDYLYFPICFCDWSPEFAGKLRDFLKCFFKHLGTVDRTHVQVLVEIASKLRQLLSCFSSDPDLRAIAINSVVSDVLLDVIKQEGNSQVRIVVEAAYIADEGMLNAAAENLRADNRSLVVGFLEAVRNAELKRADRLLDFLMANISQPDMKSVQKVIGTINELLPILKGLCQNRTVIEVEYAALCTKAQYLNDLSKILSNTAAAILHSGTAEHLVKMTVIRYLLAGPQQRLQFAMDLAITLGRFARNSYVLSHDMERSSYETAGTDSIHSCKGLLAFMSLESIRNVFLEASQYAAAVGTVFDASSFHGMLRLAVAIFDSDFATHFAALSKTRLMKGGIASGDYLQEWKSLESIKSSIYISTVSEWATGRRKRTDKHPAAFKAFINWLIANKHVPRSIEVILKMRLGHL